NSEISGGHYVTKIAKALGYYVNEDLDKCLDPIESEEWNHKMFVKELDRANLRLRRLGDWNENLNKIERRDVWKDAMLMRNGYMLAHSMPILHHLADQANYNYPTYEPPNLLPYPYPYVPYPHPYRHYPDIGKPSYGGGQYGAPGDAYLFTGTMPNYGGNSIIPSSGYEMGGSSRGVQNDDDGMSDQMVSLEDCVESGDDMDD
ncbi:hypothetical protein Tco_0836510, partial [Tanacetum coccineum]